MAMSFKSSGVMRYVAVAVAGTVTLLTGTAIPFLIKKNVPDPTAAPVTVFQLALSGASSALERPVLNVNTVGTLTASGHLVARGLGTNAFLRSTSSGMIAPATSVPVTLSDANSYYVNDTGDSMTGALLVQILANGAAATAKAGVVVEVVGNLSGATIYASSGLATSGSLTVTGDAMINEARDALDVLLTFASDTTDETLKFLNLEDRFEFSDDLNATGNLTASGTLIIAGAVSLKGDATINSDQGAVDTVLTFGSDTVNETLKFLNLEDRFEFSDDVNATGNLTASGTIIVAGLASFKGDLTMNSDAGAANVVLTFGSDGTNETLSWLNVEDRFQFSDDVNATGNLTASGDLIVEGVARVEREIEFAMFGVNTDVATGSGNSPAFVVPSNMSGFKLSDIQVNVYVAGTTNTTDVQLQNTTKNTDMLSTIATIDSTEFSTDTAATPPVVNTNSNIVATDDVLVPYVKAISTTAPKGLTVRMRFEPQ